MPRTNWLLVAAAVLPLLVPPSAVSHPPGSVFEATEISSAKVCGADVCREVSDPEAATALTVGPRAGRDREHTLGRQLGPRGTIAPNRGLPWYKGTLTFPVEDGGEVSTDRVSVIVVPSAGLMQFEDISPWLTLPSESKEAYAKLTAGLTPRPARTLPGVGVDGLPAARVDEVVEPPSTATPEAASDGSNGWIVALGGGLIALLVLGPILWIRHRRASTPPAAPDAPGAA